jgi:hypothetical protein
MKEKRKEEKKKRRKEEKKKRRALRRQIPYNPKRLKRLARLIQFSSSNLHVVMGM